MKIIERTSWLSVCVIASIIAISAWNREKLKDTLIQTYEASSEIERSMFNDMVVQMDIKSSNEYNKGFHDGQNNLGVAMMEGYSRLNYSDGYHAAIWQNAAETISVPSDASLDRAVDDIISGLINSSNASQGTVTTATEE
jgi:hypothetical protein